MVGPSNLRPLVLAALGLVFPAWANDAEGPPMEVVRGLASEAYPERVAAERQLREWATKAGPAGVNWLGERAEMASEPEVRERSRAVLKEVVMDQLTERRPGFVGIQMSAEARADAGGKPRTGVVVLGVLKGSPAEKAGLQVNDVVVELDGKGWHSGQPQHEFAGRVGGMKAGTKVRLKVLRSGEPKELELDLELAARPWSAGEYTPDATSRRFLSEDQARNEAFQEWLEDYRARRPRPRQR